MPFVAVGVAVSKDAHQTTVCKQQQELEKLKFISHTR